jgi:alkanesulfonate monooxygenase SsuD/methylene tetrahydromethanopterin reductase-like flavin-dependent oxidoreductase (luciferase family)
MRYGITFDNGDPRLLAELAYVAERAGWDGVFLEDYIIHHRVPDAPTHDPWVALAAMAMRTERVRIGTSVTPLSRRRPWKVAREALTLDHLSGGRMILGVGAGDTGDPGFGRVGEVMDLRRRAAMLDEALAIITGLWSGEPFGFHGQHYHIEEMTFLPPPVQQPHIPIWVGGNWLHPGPIRRAARWDGFCGGKVHGEDEDWHLTPAEIGRLKADIEHQRTSDAPYDIVLGGSERGDDWERERAIIRASALAGATWWIEYIHAGLGGPDALRAHVECGPLRSDD